MTTVAQVAVVLQSMPPRVQSAVFDAIGPELAVPLIQAISAAAPNLNVDFACRELLADLLASHPEVLLPRLRFLRRTTDGKPGRGPTTAVVSGLSRGGG